MHPNIFYNKNIRLESVHNAIEQGKTVAASIMGENISIIRFLGFGLINIKQSSKL